MRSRGVVSGGGEVVRALGCGEGVEQARPDQSRRWSTMSSFHYARLSDLTLIGLALFASLEVGAPVQARTPYDGLWSVSLKVSQGSCVDREIELFIRNGEISHAGDRGFFTAEGRVGERGRVEASIGALGMWASADGQLSDGQGSGVWQFPERGCSGRWVARRSSSHVDGATASPLSMCKGVKVRT